MTGAGGSEDFFAELVNAAPDAAVELITKAAEFLKDHRTASAPLHLAPGYTDMRKGVDGLVMLVQKTLKKDSYAGTSSPSGVRRRRSARSCFRMEMGCACS